MQSCFKRRADFSMTRFHASAPWTRGPCGGTYAAKLHKEKVPSSDPGPAQERHCMSESDQNPTSSRGRKVIHDHGGHRLTPYHGCDMTYSETEVHTLTGGNESGYFMCARHRVIHYLGIAVSHVIPRQHFKRCRRTRMLSWWRAGYQKRGAPQNTEKAAIRVNKRWRTVSLMFRRLVS